MRENNKVIIPQGWYICGGMVCPKKLKLWEKTQRD